MGNIHTSSTRLSNAWNRWNISSQKKRPSNTHSISFFGSLIPQTLLKIRANFQGEKSVRTPKSPIDIFLLFAVMLCYSMHEWSRLWTFKICSFLIISWCFCTLCDVLMFSRFGVLLMGKLEDFGSTLLTRDWISFLLEKKLILKIQVWLFLLLWCSFGIFWIWGLI